MSPCPSVALDPDQFLDDIFNRLKLAVGVHFVDVELFGISVFKTIGQPVAFFRPPDGIPLLKPGPLLRRYPWKNVVFLQSRKRF